MPVVMADRMRNGERVTAVSVIAGYEEWWRKVEAQWIVRYGNIPFHATGLERNPPRED